MSSDAPHLPRPASIDAYGKGGFRFADLVLAPSEQEIWCVR